VSKETHATHVLVINACPCIHALQGCYYDYNYEIPGNISVLNIYYACTTQLIFILHVL